MKKNKCKHKWYYPNLEKHDILFARRMCLVCGEIQRDLEDIGLYNGIWENVPKDSFGIVDNLIYSYYIKRKKLDLILDS